MGTYSWEQEVCKAKTFLVQYRKIQYVANETPFFIVIDKKILEKYIFLNLSELLQPKD
jgi:hypothetical protein